MTSQRRPTFVLIVIAVFFVAGVMTVLLGAEPNGSAGDFTEQPAGQQLLVLGVDDLTSAAPRLVSVWQVGFSADGRELYLLGEAVDRPVCNGRETVLRELFSWDDQEGVGQEFMQAFEGGPPSAYVVADEIAFSRLIEQLDGVELNGALLQADQVIAVLRTLYQNPAGLLTSQEQFLIALGRRAADTGSRMDLNSLVELIPEHAYSSVPPQELFTLYLRLQPLDSSSILVFAPPTSVCDN